jgi:hypothetical protein
MSSSQIEAGRSYAVDVAVTDSELIVKLADGRTLTAPLSWYPRLANADPDERARWEFTSRDEGIHWPELDEDISIEGLLAGAPPGSPRSHSIAGFALESGADLAALATATLRNFAPAVRLLRGRLALRAR